MENAPASPYRDDIVISWPELHRDTRLLCHQLVEKGPFKGIIAIARGGLIPAALVARELEIRLVDTICASSYEAADDDSATGGPDVARGIFPVVGVVTIEGSRILSRDEVGPLVDEMLRERRTDPDGGRRTGE